MTSIWIWFESPHRIQDSIQQVVNWAEENQVDLKVVAAKELTKIHETIFAGDARSVFFQIQNELAAEGELGEWCFGIEWPKSNKAQESSSDDSNAANSTWVLALQCLLEEGVSASRAAKRVSQVFDVPKNQVYQRAMILKPKN